MSVISITDETARGKLFSASKPSYLDRSRADGERDLIELAKTVENELAWNLLLEQSRWVSNKRETFQRTVRGAKVRATRLSPIRDVSNQVISPQAIYHTHPESALYEKTGDPATDAFYHVVGSSFLALPSSADLYIAAEFPRIKHKIASPNGITTYKLLSSDVPLPFLLVDANAGVSLAKDFVAGNDIEGSVNAMISYLEDRYPVSINFKSSRN